MAEKESILELWDSHWSGHQASPIDQVTTRYAREAFAGLMAFIGDEDVRVLEVACGTGRLCALLARERPRTRVTGVDLSPSSLKMAAKLRETLGLRNLSFVKADLFNLPYRAGQFDVVLSEGVIQHFRMGGQPSCEASVREMVRVLRPGGTLITGVVNWHCYPHTLYKWLLECRHVSYEYGYEKSFSKSELKRFLLAQGLEDLDACAYYPAHGFYRLAAYSRLFFWLGRGVDRIHPHWFTNTFGFEMLIKARKTIRPQSFD